MDRMQPEMGISQDRLFAARIIEQGRELLAGIQRLGVAFPEAWIPRYCWR
jgi:hypothetical protein